LTGKRFILKQQNAEYAASDSIIETLKEVGVDNAQGYAIARPVPLSSLTIEAKIPALTSVKKDQPAG
jgi:EAL domain-containing protein (putative c-di-GMP-specific phosphodiesterase class I)